jgi:hypothetical protein
MTGKNSCNPNNHNSNTTQPQHAMTLQTDCLREILKNCDLGTFSVISRTCKKYNDLIKTDNLLWAHKFCQMFPRNIISTQIRKLMMSLGNWNDQEKEQFLSNNYKLILMHYRKKHANEIPATVPFEELMKKYPEISAKNAHGNPILNLSVGCLQYFVDMLKPKEYDDGDLYSVYDCASLDDYMDEPYLVLQNRRGKFVGWDFYEDTSNSWEKFHYTTFPEFPIQFNSYTEKECEVITLSTKYVDHLAENFKKINENKPTYVCQIGDIEISTGHVLHFFDKNGQLEICKTNEKEFKSFLSKFLRETDHIYLASRRYAQKFVLLYQLRQC